MLLARALLPRRVRPLAAIVELAVAPPPALRLTRKRRPTRRARRGKTVLPGITYWRGEGITE
jgi:hypothetical protein